MQFTPQVRSSYESSWDDMEVTPGRIPQLEALAKKFAANRAKYEAVERFTGVPWWWVAIVHQRESDCDFSTHLANGDPLNHPTTHVPAGRGPFATWEDGAVDALRYMGLDKISDWSWPRPLYEFERYNGWGYIGKTNSPYVWSWSNLYSHGKYVADGQYSSGFVDPQPGCAPMLWELIELEIIPDPSENDNPEQNTQTQENDPMGSWLANIALSMLGSAQIQALVRKLLTVVGTALLVKLGLDPSTAGGLLGQVITALGGAVALGSSAFLSAQWASPNISNPTRIDPKV